VDLVATVPGVDDATAQDLTDKAHQMCPYSKATRGNIEVTVTGKGA
ncbi:MAG: organic hydroperoxide resistance protein, partial [Ornithinimicrobium sp.]